MNVQTTNKSAKGKLLIATTVLITLVVWLTATPAMSITALDKARHVIGGLSLSGLFLVFLLSTRNKTIEKWFGGLDRVYVYHRYLAIASVVAIAVHSALAELVTTVSMPGTSGLSITDLIKLQTAQTGGVASPVITPALVFAYIGAILFAILTLISLFNHSLKYETWRITHRLMLIGYLSGLVHTYLSSKYTLLQFSALSIWTGGTALVGICCAVYIIFIYQRRAFRHRGSVTAIERLGPNVIEIEITLDEPLAFTPGQFAFIKVFQEGIEQAPHPFSISGGAANRITITVKASGDYSRQLYDSLQLNTHVALDGPYGHMDFSDGKANQVWIAGGIGITPFISYLREGAGGQSIEMFYSYRGQEEAVYREFLEAYQMNHPNFRVTFIDTSVDNRLDLGKYVFRDDTCVYMCGPTKMMDSLAKSLRDRKVNADLVYEGFALK